jgi:hypothetical protein
MMTAVQLQARVEWVKHKRRTSPLPNNLVSGWRGLPPGHARRWGILRPPFGGLCGRTEILPQILDAPRRLALLDET